jgi:DNA-binding transcriptional ArsR family regulator
VSLNPPTTFVDDRMCVSLDLRLVMTYQLTGLAALGDPTRRTIFERVAERPRAVIELAREMPISRPAVSQHLKVLKEAGLVIDRAEGNRRIYAANPDGLAELRAYLEQFWNTALASFKAIVDQPTKESS